MRMLLVKKQCVCVCVCVVTGFLWSEWITDFTKEKEQNSRI